MAGLNERDLEWFTSNNNNNDATPIASSRRRHAHNASFSPQEVLQDPFQRDYRTSIDSTESGSGSGSARGGGGSSRTTSNADPFSPPLSSAPMPNGNRRPSVMDSLLGDFFPSSSGPTPTSANPPLDSTTEGESTARLIRFSEEMYASDRDTATGGGSYAGSRLASRSASPMPSPTILHHNSAQLIGASSAVAHHHVPAPMTTSVPVSAANSPSQSRRGSRTPHYHGSQATNARTPPSSSHFYPPPASLPSSDDQLAGSFISETSSLPSYHSQPPPPSAPRSPNGASRPLALRSVSTLGSLGSWVKEEYPVDEPGSGGSTATSTTPFLASARAQAHQAANGGGGGDYDGHERTSISSSTVDDMEGRYSSSRASSSSGGAGEGGGVSESRSKSRSRKKQGGLGSRWPVGGSAGAGGKTVGSSYTNWWLPGGNGKDRRNKRRKNTLPTSLFQLEGGLIPGSSSHGSSSSGRGHRHHHHHHHHHHKTSRDISPYESSVSSNSCDEYCLTEESPMSSPPSPGYPLPKTLPPPASSSSYSRRGSSNSLFSRRTRNAPNPLLPHRLSLRLKFQMLVTSVLRHPLFPTRTPTIIFFLLLLSSFIYCLTTFLMYTVFNVDREPLPWRSYCQNQPEFPHALANELEPVNVFVGVFSVDAAYERRHLIRNTYMRQSLGPVNPAALSPTLAETAEQANGGSALTGANMNIQVRFILGKPRAQHARRVALEMETFGDIVVLDMAENMNRGKTFAFFSWAAENATIPFYYRDPLVAETSIGGQENVGVGFRKADYVVKADDDSFIVLSELERHLRVAPREKMYWGYLIRNRFMGGECYGLSADLVDYVANYPPLLDYTRGAEDKRVATWMRMHPNASQISWVTERCWMYDHPKGGTTYSHGFLFPNEVERVKAEGRTGITEEERLRRGGIWSQAWSTVTKWRKEYAPPTVGMTMEEEVEALVEGGGRWGDWTHNVTSDEALRYGSLVFEPNDPRLRHSPVNSPSSNSQHYPPLVNGVTAAGKPAKTGGRKGGSLSGPPDPASYAAEMDQLRQANNRGPSLDGTASRSGNRFITGSTKIGHDLMRDPVEFAETLAAREAAAADSIANSGESDNLDTSTAASESQTTRSSSTFSNSASRFLGSSTGGETSGRSSTLGTPSSDEKKSGDVKTSQQSSAQSSAGTTPSDLDGPITSGPSGSNSHFPEYPPFDQHLAQGRIDPDDITYVPSSADRLVPPPSFRYDPEYTATRQRRFLGLPHGGTVVVHYLKRNEWFLETALALLGRQSTWSNGFASPGMFGSVTKASDIALAKGSNTGEQQNIHLQPGLEAQDGGTFVPVQGAPWGSAKMYGSPVLREDGYIAEGRPVVKAEPVPAPEPEDLLPSRLRGRPKAGVADLPAGPRFNNSVSQVTGSQSSTASDLELDTSSTESSPTASGDQSSTRSSVEQSSAQLESFSSNSTSATFSPVSSSSSVVPSVPKETEPPVNGFKFQGQS